jgi:hypothetical protein
MEKLEQIKVKSLCLVVFVAWSMQAGDEHRAMEPGVQEHQGRRQGDEMGGPGADGVLEGQPGRGVAAAAGAAGLQRHQPVARRDHAPELDRRGQRRVPALQALHPVHPQVTIHLWLYYLYTYI